MTQKTEVASTAVTTVSPANSRDITKSVSGVDAKVFLGKTKVGSQNKSEALNLVYRLIHKDGQDYFSEPTEAEWVANRICIWITGGEVTRAEFK